MTSYADLSPCDYFGEGHFRDSPMEGIDQPSPQGQASASLLAVGWLSSQAEYSRGPVDSDFLQKLLTLLVDPWEPARFRGYHDCEFCRYPGPKTIHHWRDVGPHQPIGSGCVEIRLGARNLFVPGGGVVYAAPSLIAHYLDAHEYCPPEEFCKAVLACPPMGSSDYEHALRVAVSKPRDAVI